MTEQAQPNDYRSDAFALAYPETAEFWRDAEEGRLLRKGCDDCGRHHWHLRVVCPFRGSEKTSGYTTSGKGVIYSFSVVERADPPYILTWVALREGPVLITNIVGNDANAIGIGAAVDVRFEACADGRTVPVFTLAQ